MTEQEAIALRAENAELRQEVKSLTEKLTFLLKVMSQPLIKKDSHNSSLPPSTDLFTPSKSKSLRPPSVLKSGGQPGHEGTTLEMRANPDKITDLKNDYCRNCGASLQNYFKFV